MAIIDDKWYVFSCQKKPIQMEKGHSPRMPFRAFNAKQDAESYISIRDCKKQHPQWSACPGMLEALKSMEETKVIASEEMVEIPPRDIVDANMIKRGFLKPRMSPKTLTIDFKPRIR